MTRSPGEVEEHISNLLDKDPTQSIRQLQRRLYYSADVEEIAEAKRAWQLERSQTDEKNDLPQG